MGTVDFEAITKRARGDLVLSTARGTPDIFLWEHSSRVAECARHVARLPEVAAGHPDEVVVYVAGLYHDAGWAIRCRAGEIDRTEVLLTPTSEAACDLAAGLLERSLDHLLPSDTLEAAARAVRLWPTRGPSFLEAEIVAEAEHLEEFGLLPLWIAVRRGIVEGKGVQAVLESWRRKQEYQFWRSRLKDSFRFAQTRELARRRFETMEKFMADLDEQHCARDLAQIGGPRGEVPEILG
jgi:hypothetical protein